MKYQNTIYNAPNKNQKTKCSLSIIIPCYNEQKIILKSISKIRKLKKTFPDLEIIVCELMELVVLCAYLKTYAQNSHGYTLRKK